MEKITKLQGLIAAPHTIFKSNGDINLDAINLQVEMLIKQNVKGAYISGTTGEGISCSVAERLQIMERWSIASQGRLKLIIHTGALSIKDVITLAQRANELKIFATSIVVANYFKPCNMDILVKFCQVAAEAAPDCGFYYYHTTMSGINFSMVDFLKAADGVIPNLCGIKYNSPDLYEYQNCRSCLDGKYDIVYGVDEFFAGALALGAEAFIGSTYNYVAELFYSIWQLFDNNDMKKVQKNMVKVCQIVDLLVEYGGVAAGKAMLQLHNVDGGDVRLPLKKLTQEEKNIIVNTAKGVLSK